MSQHLKFTIFFLIVMSLGSLHLAAQTPTVETLNRPLSIVTNACSGRSDEAKCIAWTANVTYLIDSQRRKDLYTALAGVAASGTNAEYRSRMIRLGANREYLSFDDSRDQSAIYPR